MEKKQYRVTEKLIRYYWPDACDVDKWTGDPITLSNIAYFIEKEWEDEEKGLKGEAQVCEFFRKVLKKDCGVKHKIDLDELENRIPAIKYALFARLDKLEEEEAEQRVATVYEERIRHGSFSYRKPWSSIYVIADGGETNYYPERPVEDLAKVLGGWLDLPQSNYTGLAGDILNWIASHDKAVVR
jgi:hypothetical protein